MSTKEADPPQTKETTLAVVGGGGAGEKEKMPLLANQQQAILAGLAWAAIGTVGGFFYGILRSKTIEKGLPTLKKLPVVKTAVIHMNTRLCAAFVQLSQYRNESKMTKYAYDNAIAFAEEVLLSCAYVKSRYQEKKPINAHWYVAKCETDEWQVRKYLQIFKENLPADVKNTGDKHTFRFRATGIIDDILRHIKNERSSMEVFCKELILKT